VISPVTSSTEAGNLQHYITNKFQCTMDQEL